MHTNTFQSRFKVGDKITNGAFTITIASIGMESDGTVYYKAKGDSYTLYYETSLIDYHLAPRFSVGDSVWLQNQHAIVEGVVAQHCYLGYYIQGLNMPRHEDDLFSTAEACRATIKVIPLE